MQRLLFLLVLTFFAIPDRAWADNALPPAARRTVDFRADIYPILKNHCFRCHADGNPSSGHRLDLHAELTGESNGRPIVIAGKSADSKLIQLVSELKPGKVMPPAQEGKPLSPEQIGLLRAWIDQGVKWDDGLLPPLVAGGSKHWAYQPIKRPAVPEVKQRDWVRNPIDAFIAREQEKRKLKPAEEASRRVLIQRLSFDLTGLPPTPEEVDAFVADAAPDAYEKVVERLLASPQYGERWGRHWLDLARYADSEGYESDHLRPYAWRYRDYVIKAFNDDKPYDRFLREQIAGDEIEPYRDENLIATGFLASARLSSNEEDKPRQRNDMMVDVVNATASVTLGLTFNCAQCHSHKFDPITARDYYRFMGFFVKGAPNNLVLKDEKLWAEYEARKPAEYDPAKKLEQVLYEKGRAALIEKAKNKLTAEQQAALALPADKRTAEQERLAREADLKFQFTPGQIEKGIPDADKKLYDEVKKKVAELEKNMPDKPQTFGFYSPATSPSHVDVLPMKGFYPPEYNPGKLARNKPYLLVQGDVHRRGAEVDVGWPALFGAAPRTQIAQRPRSALVDWLVHDDNPLTARVWANRVWQYHFGRGLVATPSDFGVRGEEPTHPELLDWLACELRGKKWSTKHLHRLIVCSTTYRQAARTNAASDRVDPDNLYLSHWTTRRLEVEAIRDALLAVSGELDVKIGGTPGTDENTNLRRTIYLLQRRQQPPKVQRLFDGPDAAAESCPKRNTSTVPLQALYLLNNDFAFNRAQAFARRVLEEAGPERTKQVDRAFRLALGRLPDDVERAAAAKFFASNSGDENAELPVPLVLFCQALLNTNEFVYLE
ncbi:MAG: DUF1549 domain-containing protein [Gemmataceae bacterium]